MSTGGLFTISGSPLADRMRPRTLDEVVGQQKLVGPQGVLRAVLASPELQSMVFWGPPGTGKTTLARLFADAAGAEVVAFSAVLSGVKHARAVMDEARERLQLTGRRTVLFVDEIHRFNRAQQDAFLPYVEAGDVVLVGATTENPSFELNRALQSRVRVFILDPLTEPELVEILDRAMADSERGLAGSEPTIDGGAVALIAGGAAGDARQALNHLELAVNVAASEGLERVDEAVAARVAGRVSAFYDKGREEHFNLISALHKSVRNSDPDASIYWLARMLEGGADPKYIARRLFRIASEDVGMADPRALQQVASAARAVEHMGMPECELALAQAVVYLAVAPKSNALYLGYGAAKKEVRNRPGLAIPMQIRNAPTALMKSVGYGDGYHYAHDEPGGVADMKCLPEELDGVRFYRPTEHGWEFRIRERLREIEAARRKK